ncbi:hypothetical protein VNO78_10854 [Psophocarpus tetragonolobus]|uniref:Uncharacterized protein n=1 Tax=Psophocarpus tetragonolobus TaxID=3891 RepID=A0AAN9SN52_PSOTE
MGPREMNLILEVWRSKCGEDANLKDNSRDMPLVQLGNVELNKPLAKSKLINAIFLRVVVPLDGFLGFIVLHTSHTEKTFVGLGPILGRGLIGVADRLLVVHCAPILKIRQGIKTTNSQVELTLASIAWGFFNWNAARNQQGLELGVESKVPSSLNLGGQWHNVLVTQVEVVVALVSGSL